MGGPLAIPYGQILPHNTHHLAHSMDIRGLVFIICCALLIASLLNSRYLKSNSARAFFKTATFLPNICAAIAMGLIFRMLFDENVGLVNEVVTMFGGSKIPWLTSTTFSKIPREVCIQLLSEYFSQKKYVIWQDETEDDWDELEPPATRVLNWLLRTAGRIRGMDYEQ